MRKTILPILFYFLLLSFFSATIFFSSCGKFIDDDRVYSPMNSIDLSTRIISSASGFVTDENDQPVLNASVQVGDLTISTDKYGFFEAKNATVVKNAATVIVSKAGYFKAIKTYIATDGKATFFRIKMIPKTIAGTVNGASGGVLTLTNGLSISFPANAVVNALSNAAYTGTVNIAAHWIDPTSADLPLIMPGDLRGLDTKLKIQLLTTYGMAAIELTGASGELLQLAPDKKATLSLPIPSSIASTAPATIPLWYMDEAMGLWKEEGIATKTGSKYVGEVSHFSFWNFDTPASFVMLNATIVYTIGGSSSTTQPLQNVKVKMSEVGNPANFRYGYTDSAGYVSGPVPPNTQLLFEVYGNLNCPTAVYTQTVTTTTTNISLGTISISNGNNIATITGNVVNCSNTPVTNGYILVKSGPYYTAFRLSNTGSYSAGLVLCSSTGNAVTLIGEDITTQQQSNPVIYNIMAGNNVISTLQTCTNTPTTGEFVHYIINGVPRNHDSPPYYIRMFQYTSTVSVGTYADPASTVPVGNFSFTQAGLGVGSTQTLTYITIPVGTGFGMANLVINNPPVNVSITECGLPVTGYVAGNFSGGFTGPAPTNIPYTITCSFRVRRS